MTAESVEELGPLFLNNGMTGLAARLLPSVTVGSVYNAGHEVTNEPNDCVHHPPQWTYCQHKDGVTHDAGVNVDDTWAWDINLSGNEDEGKSVYAVAPGTVVTQYPDDIDPIAPGSGTEHTVLIEHCYTSAPCNCELTPTDCWWSRYLHMIDVPNDLQDKPVTPATFLGRISGFSGGSISITPHLHFAIYHGENRREAGQGQLISVDAIFIEKEDNRGDMIFRDGFE